METAPKGRRTRLGVWFAAIYIILVAAALALATIGKGDEFGYRWIPFVELSMPWFAVLEHFFTPDFLLPAIPGFVLNAGILFLAGRLIGKRPSAVGTWLSAIYLILVIAGHILSDTNPYNVRLALTVEMLAMPWYRLSDLMPIIGVFLNAGILYLIGMLVQMLSRSFARRSA